MALPKHLQSALQKYAFDPKNPAGPAAPAAPKSVTPPAPAPAGGLGSLGSGGPAHSLLSGGQNLGGNKGGSPLMPPQPKPLGLAASGTNTHNPALPAATATPTLSLAGGAPTPAPAQTTVTTGGSAPAPAPAPADNSALILNSPGGEPAPTQQTPAPAAQGTNAAPTPAPEGQPTTAPAQQQPGQQQPAATGQPGQQTQAQPATPKTPEQQQQANNNLMARMNDPNVPDADKKQAAQQHVQQMLDSKPEMKQGMADLHAGKDTPQAKAFQAEVDKAGNAYVREEFARLRQQNPGAGPQEQGGMLQNVMQSYQNMPEPMKWMMGIGLGGGLLGVLGSMFGGGGGMGMLGLLGLGAAGLAGAGGGMFGQGAQNFMADAIGGIGKSLGMMPEKLTDQQKQILLAKDPVAHITNGAGGIPTRAAAGKQVAEGRQQLGQIQMLNSMGGMTPRMLENMGLSAEEAQLAAKNVGTLSSQYADQNSALNQHLQKGEAYSKPTWSSWAQELGSIPWRQKTSAEHGCNLALQWAKEARCWKGYEPVPGKAPYSENSCRPIGSKKKKKKTEKKAEEVFDEWLKKYRARGQKGRWVNTRRGSKTELKVSHN